MTIKEGTGMRPTNTAPTSLSKDTKATTTATSPTSAARPFPVSNTNLSAPATSSDQVKAALDTLGIKLIKSEAERDVLKKLVEETRQMQQRLERELQENRKELAETRRKMDEQHNESEQSKNRQERLEEKLREAQASTLKLTRKLEADEQKRTRMQRRMERLEAVAAEAQTALQAKAMVLLTDQTMAEKTGMPMLSATGEVQALPAPTRSSYLTPAAADLQSIVLDEPSNTSWWSTPMKLNTSVAMLALVAALGFGWLASTSFQNGNQNAVAVMADGSLARIDLKNGTLQPLQLSLKKLDENAVAAAAEAEADKPKVTAAGDPLPQTKPAATAEAQPDQAELIPPVAAPPRDASLTDSLKELQDKAYAGVAEAQHDLAALYTAGSGVKQDYKRAAYWFHQAADAGVANAAYNLGVLHHQGLGVEKNIQIALDWYRLAAVKGHPEAQYNLGIAYIEGIGTKYNPQLAAGFFQKAALAGITEAAYNLGLILENGLLSEPKPQQAMMWYRVGSEGGSIEARNALDQLAKRMNVPSEKAGFLPDGTSLTKLVTKPDNVEPAGVPATAINETLDKLMPELAELIPGDDQLLVAQIQEQLTRREMYDGPEDGAMSQKTVDSIKKYEKKSDIGEDGKPTTDLLTRMLKESTANE
ncbi:MAG: SEL1-like repeat protein [Alphaproteobacteria bacterium]|nr:SEL1-like repeat protein [Alphaproteobacteria bacterium]